MVTKEGGVVRGGCEVVGLQKDGKKIDGVVLKSGEVVKGDIILVCFTFHRFGLVLMIDCRWSLVRYRLSLVLC